jgi:type VI secretion system protein ImpF
MAELILQDRLQPALLDRLTDDEPEKRLESREQRVISLTKLRQCILRDLSWLLNTVRLEATEDLSECSAVQRSVLNYGLPSFTGGSIALLGAADTEAAIKQAILRFEPRLLPNSVKVKVIESSLREDAHNTMALEIEAELWCQPLPLHMFMKTELDLEIGTARLTERSEADAKRPDRPRSRRR